MNKTKAETKNITKNNKQLVCWVAAAFAVMLLAGCSNNGDQAGGTETMAESGQCWSEKGGVGNLIKNSSTKAECKNLGGKSWCPTGGGCEDL